MGTVWSLGASVVEVRIITTLSHVADGGRRGESFLGSRLQLPPVERMLRERHAHGGGASGHGLASTEPHPNAKIRRTPTHRPLQRPCLRGAPRSRRGRCLALGGFALLSSCFWLTIARRHAMWQAASARRPREGQADGAHFTVMVNTFERPRQMEGAVQHYASCEG